MPKTYKSPAAAHDLSNYRLYVMIYRTYMIHILGRRSFGHLLLGLGLCLRARLLSLSFALLRRSIFIFIFISRLLDFDFLRFRFGLRCRAARSLGGSKQAP